MNDSSPPLTGAQRIVTWRAVLLGLLGVAFICGLTPYNDYVVNNTYLVGNFLPIGLLLFFIVVVMLINAPLHLFARRWAFSTGELALALSMTLISCGLPSSGLMRYLPAQLVGTWTQANLTSNAEFRKALQEADLPMWLFPTMSVQDPYGGVSDDVISHYNTSTPGVRGWKAVPWRAWVKPAIAWGTLLVFLYGTIFCVSVIVRRQWVENERLAFPLASVYLSLVEEPEPGRAVNALFRSPLFWIAAGLVFAIHFVNAMHVYWPQAFPEIPVKYNLRTIFANDPWRVVDDSFKANAILFILVGIVYFIQSSIVFSMVFCYLVMNVLVKMIYYNAGSEFPSNGHTDLQFGSALPFLGIILWVGRHHWMIVLRQMFRGEREGEPRGRYLPYSVAGWGVVVGLAGTLTWMVTIGMTFGTALLLLGMYFLLIMVIARIVAETGLIFVQINVPLARPWSYLLAGGFRTSTRSYMAAQLMGNSVGHEFRETVNVFAQHALRVGDQAAYDHGPPRARALGFALCLILALVAGFLISGASTLYAEYNYAVSLDSNPAPQISHYATVIVPQYNVSNVASYRSTSSVPLESHSRSMFFGAGFGVTTILSVLRLRYANWPIHPIGFLMATSMPMKRIWFSLLIGWIAKVIILRFGGTSLYRAARPVFMGLIIGEAGAAAFWLVVSLVRVSMGLDYTAIRLLPT